MRLGGGRKKISEKLRRRGGGRGEKGWNGEDGADQTVGSRSLEEVAVFGVGVVAGCAHSHGEGKEEEDVEDDDEGEDDVEDHPRRTFQIAALHDCVD